MEEKIQNHRPRKLRRAAEAAVFGIVTGAEKCQTVVQRGVVQQAGACPVNRDELRERLSNLTGFGNEVGVVILPDFVNTLQ